MNGPRLLRSLDLTTVVVALLLAAIGVLAIASATMDQEGRENLWWWQVIWLALALLACLVVVTVDYHGWAAFALVLHGLALVLLIVVLLAGREVGGNRSWLAVGSVSVQPSELAKWTTCLALATYLARRVRAGIGLREAVEMGLIAGLPVGLVAMQPDMGTALTFVPIYLAALFLGGVRWKLLVAVLILGVLLAPIGWAHLKDYQKERILTVLDPERDPAGVGYQVRQSKIAVGSGRIAGKGFGNGTQSRLNFLPAHDTDFILAVIAEEFGFVGALAVLGLFYVLLFRCILAARSAQDRLGTYISLLVLCWLGGQIAVNVGMVLGYLPTIGVPLPLLSRGGSALLATMCGVGLIVNVRSRRFVN